MAIRWDVLGQPGRDNALFLVVDTGQAQHRLLFDCGEDVLAGIAVSEVQQIEAVFFSHFHFDHVAGFDHFFRLNWYRTGQPVRFFGPAGAREILSHRLRGVTWNLVADATGEVHVTELAGESVRRSRYLAREGFATEHPLGQQPCYGVLYQGAAFDVLACPLNHGIVSLAYVVSEHERVNVDPAALADLGLRAGPWVRLVKDSGTPDDLPVAGGRFRVGELRDRILVRQPGDRVAYLTDFLLEDRASEDRLVEMLEGCGTVVCESMYRDEDAELARRNHHLTSSDVGRLATRVGPERLVLFHLSDRYSTAQWQQQLTEVQAIFPRAEFPRAWKIGGG